MNGVDNDLWEQIIAGEHPDWGSKEEWDKKKQKCMDQFFYGLPYDEVIAVVKENFPERFI